MKYVAYVLLLLAAVAGYVGIRVFIVPLIALATTVMFASIRWKTWKETPQQFGQNKISDMAFLYASQCLIVFVAFLLGVFVASPGGGQFAEFLRIR